MSTGKVSLALLILFTSTACGEDDPQPRNPPPTDGGRLPPSAWRAAAGADGTFVQTFDDANWQTRTVGDRDFYAVACVGNLLGWVAGEAGLALRTYDGGGTFATLDTGVSPNLRSVRFGDEKHGVVVGDAGTLLVTTDGGDTFEPASGVTDRDLHGVAFARPAGLVVAVGEGGVVLRSADLGATWETAAPFTDSALTAVAADAAADLVVATDGNGGIWSSRDLARTFTLEHGAGVALGAVALAESGEHALAVGASGAVLVRDTSGTWARAADGATSVDLHAALVTDSGTLYVAGDSGTLLGSRDFGASWAAVPTGTGSSLYALEDL